MQQVQEWRAVPFVSTWGSRLSAAQIRFRSLQQLQGIVWLKPHEWSSGAISHSQDAAVAGVRGVYFPGKDFWAVLKLSGRNSHIDSLG